MRPNATQVASAQPERLNAMKNENMKVNRTVTVVSVVVFFAAFAASVALFWKYVIDVFLNQTMFGTAMDVSAVYLISSFLFLAVLIALNVVGFILKNKYLLIITAARCGWVFGLDRGIWLVGFVRFNGSFGL